MLFNYLCEELADFKPTFCDFCPPTETVQFNKFNKAISAKCFSYSDFASGTLMLYIFCALFPVGVFFSLSYSTMLPRERKIEQKFTELSR